VVNHRESDVLPALQEDRRAVEAKEGGLGNGGGKSSEMCWWYIKLVEWLDDDGELAKPCSVQIARPRQRRNKPAGH